MDRFEHSEVVANVRSCSNAKTAYELRGLIRENISKQVGGHQHIEGLWAFDQLHRCSINVEILQFNFRIGLCNLVNCPFEDPIGYLENIPLVHESQPLPSLHSQVEGEPSHSLRCRLRDDPHGYADPWCDLEFLPGIQPFRIFSNNDHVDSRLQ